MLKMHILRLFAFAASIKLYITIDVLASFGVSAKSQFLRPTANERRVFSASWTGFLTLNFNFPIFPISHYYNSGYPDSVD